MKIKENIKGQRVGAILGSEKGTVKFFGYGIYEGEFIPKEAVGFLADICREGKRKNPRIKLDNGKVVYGCECWWGSEEAIRDQVAGYENVVVVDINKVRKEYVGGDTNSGIQTAK